jgi:hypothetical protein
MKQKLDKILMPTTIATNALPVISAYAIYKFFNDNLLAAPLGYGIGAVSQGLVASYAASFVTDRPLVIAASGLAVLAAPPVAAFTTLVSKIFDNP